MARTSSLRRMLAWHHALTAADAPDASPTDRWAAALAQRGPHLSRRALIAGAAGAGLLVGCSREEKVEAEGVRIAVLGAGMAGLACCHQLAKAGLSCTVYEATDRPGGRMSSAVGLFADAPSLVTELGGEFVDTLHTDLLALVEELGLDLLDTYEDPALERAFFFDGSLSTEAEMIEGYAPIARAIEDALASLPDGGDSISYEDAAGASTLDHTTLAEWLERVDAPDRAKRLVEVAYVGEYGLEVEEQSALNLLMLAGTTPGELELFGISDERYKILGGNQQVPDLLAERYADQIRYGASLVAITQTSEGFRLSFADGREVVADYVVCTLPFPVLRALDLRLELPDVKWSSIEQLGYGTNAKLVLPFPSALWRSGPSGPDHYTGEALCDLDLQAGWDASLLQGAPIATWSNFTGGQRGVSIGEGSAAEQGARALADLEQIFPGAQAVGRAAEAVRVHWPSVPTALGSYACYKPGQWTSIGGAEQFSVGNFYFAGEHCSPDWQGYMSGAAQTGIAAARAIALQLSGSTARLSARARACRRRPNLRYSRG